MKLIKTRKFLLRHYQKGDEISLVKNINNEKIMKYTLRIPNPYKMSDANEWIHYNMEMLTEKDPSEINMAMIVEKEVVGGLGFTNIDVHKAELGYWLAEGLWNQGLMTDAVKRMTKAGFKDLKFKRIYATVFPDNEASMKVLEKAGYEREGYLKNYFLNNSSLQDVYMYAAFR
ncbi:MAG: GNAT family N-acetyltransferase [Bacteroidetes bacterium]|nr:GNAT family N-acetyltransferase [Bacteroidota bacterium]